jgi:putative sterol carrier protein
VEVTLPAELLHCIWLGKESTADSFFSGKIKTQGSLLKMMKLTELFRAAERVYPDVAQTYGLPV